MPIKNGNVQETYTFSLSYIFLMMSRKFKTNSYVILLHIR